MKILLNCIEKRYATYQNQVNISSFLELYVAIVTFITFVTMVAVRVSNYMKVTYFDTIYASFLARRWPCILWVSLMNKKTYVLCCVRNPSTVP